MKTLIQYFAVLFLILSTNSIQAQQAEKEKFTPEQLTFFESKVRPILVAKCFECHGPESDEPEGGLYLSSRKNLLTGGDSGAAIVPGKPSDSILIEAINYSDVYEMPPSSKLPQKEIDILTKWVDMGAPWTGDEKVAKAKSHFDLKSRIAEHWVWKPVSQPAIPENKNKDWARDDLDKFVLASLEKESIKPANPADKTTWLRRVYFDLIGLPPTPTQLNNFVNDLDANAFEKVVDELLASKHFGEKWARHWMDLTRYAESCGHEFDYPIPHAFQFRDYLIRAFNEDVSYDQFIKELIAGDLLKNPRMHPTENYNESIIGTGFWFLGESTHAPVDVRENSAGHTDNRIDVMSRMFLGMTIACARCHDHKFDAISTKDYYGLAGILKSSRRQVAMVDRNQEIAKKTKEIDTIRLAAETFISKVTKQRSNSNFAEYLLAATKFVNENKAIPPSSGQMLEASKLKVRKVTSGSHQIQALTKQGKFQWNENKHLWWLDGKVGGEWEIEFNVSQTGKYEVIADMTTARDYGIAEFYIDDKKVQDPIDFYNPTGVKKTGPKTLANTNLEKGTHVLKVKLTGKNEKAIPRYMVGIDYIALKGDANKVEIEKQEKILTELSKANRLDETMLKKYVEVLRSKSLAQADHPLHVWYQAAIAEKKFAANRLKKTLGASTMTSFASTYAGQSQSELAKPQKLPHLFADFKDQKHGWFETGQAFAQTGVSESGLDWEPTKSPTGIAKKFVFHSGLKGKKQQGAIRSPTFTLDSNSIYYRIAGENCKIRVIIEHYDMDVYNGLLFGGVSFNVNTGGNFRWHRQAGDIARYKGNRAYIEIIDQGNGWVAIDQIVRSDGGQPQTQSELTRALSDQQFDSQEKLATAIGQQVKSDAGSDLLSWLTQEQLVNVPDHSLAKLSKLQADFKKVADALPAPVLVQAMSDGTPMDEPVYIRGNHKTLGKAAPRRLLEALGPQVLGDENSSGRLQLANTIASAENPLTSRVIANRLWHHLTGRGIVASTDNFGVLGYKPTHPELLDYLASQVVKENWSIKSMVRRIVLSQTYRMSSVSEDPNAKNDPENLLLHKMRVRRVQSESIRDSILALSGRLDEKLFGPSVPVHVTSFMQGRGRPGSGPLDGNGRRSVYISIKRNFLSPMMLAFDTPQPFNAVGRRSVSNVPAQALILMNDPFVIQQSEVWAKKLIAEHKDANERIKAIYVQAYSRPPSDIEIENANRFLKTQAAELGVNESKISEDIRVWRDFCHIALNIKEFIFIH